MQKKPGEMGLWLRAPPHADVCHGIFDLLWLGSCWLLVHFGFGIYYGGYYDNYNNKSNWLKA